MSSVIDRFRIDGQIALVTGASSGLGAHFSAVLASAGARVVLAARRSGQLESLATEIRARGGEARTVQLDVTRAESVRQGLDDLESWGVPDIIVNNAGITVTRELLEQTEADFDSVINTNLRGSWLVAVECARRLRDKGKPGSIINVASILGERVAKGVAPYAISKAGVIQATRSMALELARYGIRVNALLPGYVTTDLNREFLQSEAGERLRARIPSRRFCVPEDLDGPILLLASAAGAAISGATLAVDGGHLVSSL